jgi:hypothetical protein
MKKFPRLHSREVVSYLLMFFLLAATGSMFLRNMRFNTQNPLAKINKPLDDGIWKQLGIAHHGWGMLTGPTNSTFVITVAYKFEDGTTRDWEVFPIRQGYVRRAFNEVGEDLFRGMNGGMRDPQNRLLNGFFAYQCKNLTENGAKLASIRVLSTQLSTASLVGVKGDVKAADLKLSERNNHTCPK